LLLVTSGVCNAAIDWDIYSDTTISSGSYSNVNVFDSLDVPPVQTEVDMIGGDILFLHSRDTSIINISGGTINNSDAYDYSSVNITGGNFNMLAVKSENAFFHIYGYDFSIQTPSSTYILTGFWEDSSEFEIWLGRADLYGSNYVLHEIPEPASVLLFGFGGLILRA
jgi:hypothetical protein